MPRHTCAEQGIYLPHGRFANELLFNSSPPISAVRTEIENNDISPQKYRVSVQDYFERNRANDLECNPNARWAMRIVPVYTNPLQGVTARACPSTRELRHPCLTPVSLLMFHSGGSGSRAQGLVKRYRDQPRIVRAQRRYSRRLCSTRSRSSGTSGSSGCACAYRAAARHWSVS